jgi:hypothetical protein
MYTKIDDDHVVELLPPSSGNSGPRELSDPLINTAAGHLNIMKHVDFTWLVRVLCS